MKAKIKKIRSTAMKEVVGEHETLLVSYETPVAACIMGKYYKTEDRCSKSTSRHLNEWLDSVKAEERPQTFFDELYFELTN